MNRRNFFGLIAGTAAAMPLLAETKIEAGDVDAPPAETQQKDPFTEPSPLFTATGH